MRNLLLSVLGVSIVACVTPRRAPTLPRFELPAPYTMEGLEVRVTGYYTLGTGPRKTIQGLQGVARNTTGEPLGTIVLTFDALDDEGNRVAEAIATTTSLEADGRWRFRAMVITDEPERVARVEPRTVQALPPLQ